MKGTVINTVLQAELPSNSVISDSDYSIKGNMLYAKVELDERGYLYYLSAFENRGGMKAFDDPSGVIATMRSKQVASQESFVLEEHVELKAYSLSPSGEKPLNVLLVTLLLHVLLPNLSYALMQKSTVIKPRI